MNASSALRDDISRCYKEGKDLRSTATNFALAQAPSALLALFGKSHIIGRVGTVPLQTPANLLSNLTQKNKMELFSLWWEKNLEVGLQ